MLYDQWQAVARARAGAPALRDIASGKQWTFGELLRLGETRVGPPRGTLVSVQGNGPEFIFRVLAAWRSGAVLCPLDPGQTKPQVPLPPPECVHLKITSATSSGTPRLVAFTAEQLAADAEHIVATMGLRPDWPNLGVISLAHSYGFSNLILPLLLHGIPLILGPAPLPEMVRRAAADEPAITLPAVPALWRAWHEAEAIPGNVRLAISAGAPLPAALERLVFERQGLKIHNFYGSSECGGIAYDGTAQPRAEDAYVGAPMKAVALDLNEIGCLRVRSRAVGQTYWPIPEKALERGVFQTADLADLRAGAVYIRGRVGDLINVAGRKVAPEHIEQTLAEHPHVRECLVFGVPSRDQDRSDQIVAVIYGRDHGSSESMRQFLLERLPAWQIPREWWLVDSPLANHRGKASRAAWREKFLTAKRPA